MHRFSTGSTLALAVALLAAPAFASQTHHTASAAHKHGVLHRISHRIGRHSKSHAPIGQRGIAPERATEIQTALIREKYLDGTPSGQWDSQTEAAMQKYQAAHGWQTKLTPDSRALISLGLGPSTPSGPETLPANTYTPSEPAEAGTLASVHSISQ